MGVWNAVKRAGGNVAAGLAPRLLGGGRTGTGLDPMRPGGRARGRLSVGADVNDGALE